ncbi:hypothetical protein BB560_003283, partial [Smittium megazygosporum]
SILKTRRIQKDRHDNPIFDERLSSQRLVQMFYAQRNIYLTGFTLLLGLVMRSTYQLIVELLETKTELSNARVVKSVNSAASGSDLASKVSKIKELEKQLQEAQKEIERLESINPDAPKMRNRNNKGSSKNNEYEDLVDDHKVVLDQIKRSNQKKKSS